MIDASVKTLVVSWNETADMKELVCKDAFVIPNKTLSKIAGLFLESLSFSLIILISSKSITSPVKSSESPGSFTSTVLAFVSQ